MARKLIELNNYIGEFLANHVRFPKSNYFTYFGCGHVSKRNRWGALFYEFGMQVSSYPVPISIWQTGRPQAIPISQVETICWFFLWGRSPSPNFKNPEIEWNLGSPSHGYIRYIPYTYKFPIQKSGHLASFSNVTHHKFQRFWIRQIFAS